MRYPRNLKPFTGQLDGASFAGVFFLLTLFLMLHSYLAPPTGVRLRLPQVDLPNPPGLTHPLLVVAMDRDDQLYFDHQIIKETDLRTRLEERARQSKEPVTLLLQADESGRLGALTRVMAMARQAGIREVVVAARPPLFPAPAKP